MNGHLEIDHRAERELASLPDAILQRIVTKIQTLVENPFPRGIKKLKGTSGYRLRVGDYRVLYDVYPRERKIVIYAAGHRRDIYR